MELARAAREHSEVVLPEDLLQERRSEQRPAGAHAVIQRELEIALEPTAY